MFRKSDNIKKLRSLILELPIRDADVFKMREILEATLVVSTDGYWDWNVVDNVEYLSPGFKKQLGYTDEELKNVPESWMNIIHPDDLIVALELFKDHVKSRGAIEYKMVARYTHKKGHEIKILCRGSVIEWDEDNNPIRMVGTHIDITNL